MTVKELIEKLSKMKNQDSEIVFFTEDYMKEYRVSAVSCVDEYSFVILHYDETAPEQSCPMGDGDIPKCWP